MQHHFVPSQNEKEEEELVSTSYRKSAVIWFGQKTIYQKFFYSISNPQEGKSQIVKREEQRKLWDISQTTNGNEKSIEDKRIILTNAPRHHKLQRSRMEIPALQLSVTNKRLLGETLNHNQMVLVYEGLWISIC